MSTHPTFLILLLLSTSVFLGCEDPQQPTDQPARAPALDISPSTMAAVVVNSLVDPGDGVCDATQCTLREAIADSTGTSITFAPGLTGAITLARPSAGGGSLIIAKALTITGPGSGITVRRRTTDPGFRLVRIDSDAIVALTNLTFRNGWTERTGGGLINFGTLTLTHCTVAGNSAFLGGAGIDNHGPLTLVESKIANNQGDGIMSQNHSLTLINSTVARNSGIGIGARYSTLSVAHSTIAYNTAGGIRRFGGVTTVMDTKILHNSSSDDGGGIDVRVGRLTVTNSTIAHNTATFGGGIASHEGSNVSVSSSTIVANSATEAGGGISNRAFHNGRSPASLTVTNSTISGNSAPVGGGIHNSNFVEEARATVVLRSSTVTLNSATQAGGGIDLDVGELSLVNGLVANNLAPTAPDITTGSVDISIHASYSLIGDGSGSSLTNTDGNQVGNVTPNDGPIDPLLGPLANNGGPTRTHALLPGSPALDAASITDCPATDQRGVARPQGAGCDIGSYERE